MRCPWCCGGAVIIKLDRTSFKSMPPPDVWRPPAVGVKVLTSPPWQVNTSTQTHTSHAAAYRSAALCWRDKHRAHWRSWVKNSLRSCVIPRTARDPGSSDCAAAFVEFLFIYLSFIRLIALEDVLHWSLYLRKNKSDSHTKFINIQLNVESIAKSKSFIFVL